MGPVELSEPMVVPLLTEKKMEAKRSGACIFEGRVLVKQEWNPSLQVPSPPTTTPQSALLGSQPPPNTRKRAVPTGPRCFFLNQNTLL